MRREIEAIRKALISGKREVSANQTWKRICQITEAGDIEGKKIRFTQADMERLRSFVIREAGFDPTMDTLKNGRVEQSTVSVNEKLARGGVFDSMVIAGRPKGGSVPIKEMGELPAGALACVSIDKMMPPKTVSDPIVIMENGAMMAYLETIRWPDDIPNPIVLYRGHGINLPEIKKWVREVPDRALIIPFFDFDPEGIDMTRQYEAQRCIVPRNWRAIVNRSPYNNATKYMKQISKRDLLSQDTRIPSAMRRHIAQNKIAVMQEHILSHDLPITIMNFD